MTTTYLTLNEIRTIGFEALLRELGPAGTIRFIQQYETGRGIQPEKRNYQLVQSSFDVCEGPHKSTHIAPALLELL